MADEKQPEGTAAGAPPEGQPSGDGADLRPDAPSDSLPPEKWVPHKPFDSAEYLDRPGITHLITDEEEPVEEPDGEPAEEPDDKKPEDDGPAAA